MAIITNGITIPTNGDFIIVNGVKIDEVIAVKDNVNTTVWKKVIFEYKDFAYTGGVQAFVVPLNGLYKLEAWGAGCENGGQGGYTCTYASLTANQTLYIVCGGKSLGYGSMTSFNGHPTSYASYPGYTPSYDDEGDVKSCTWSGGYNGGGKGRCGSSSGGSPGGGATHIATANRGIIDNYASYEDELLVVAAGGSGAHIEKISWQDNDDYWRGTGDEYDGVNGNAGFGGSFVQTSDDLYVGGGYGIVSVETTRWTNNDDGDYTQAAVAKKDYKDASTAFYKNAAITFNNQNYASSYTAGGNSENGYARISLIAT